MSNKYVGQFDIVDDKIRELFKHLNKDTVTTCCGTDQFHMNMFWHNGKKRLFEGQMKDDEWGGSAYWCHKCNADTSVTDDYEEKESIIFWCREEARIAWMEDNNGSTVGFAEAYGSKTKEDIIAERSGYDDDDEYQNEQWD